MAYFRFKEVVCYCRLVLNCIPPYLLTPFLFVIIHPFWCQELEKIDEKSKAERFVYTYVLPRS